MFQSNFHLCTFPAMFPLVQEGGGGGGGLLLWLQPNIGLRGWCIQVTSLTIVGPTRVRQQGLRSWGQGLRESKAYDDDFVAPPQIRQ